MEKTVSLDNSGDETATNRIISNDTIFRKLSENSFSGITLLDKDFQTVYLSPSAERIVGWSVADRMKNTIDKLTHPADLKMVKQSLQEVLITPNLPKICTFRSKHFNGHFIWLQCSFTNMFHDRDVNAIVCNFVDVTVCKQSQEKIIESERFTKTITDNLPAMISYWTADQRCLFANKTMLEWFEKTPQEMTGIHKHDLIGEEEYSQYRPYIQKVLKGEPQSFERSLFKVNGKMIYTHTQYLPDTMDGAVKGFYSLTYDYNEERSIEMEVRKKTAQIEDLFENVTDGFISPDDNERLEEKNIIPESIGDVLFAVDKNWIITYWNNAAEQVLGKAKEKMINHRLWEVFDNSIESISYKKYHEAVEINQPVHFEDHHNLLNKWYEISAYPTGDGLSVYFKDITDRKKSENSLKKLNANLQKQTRELAISNAELEQFAYVASHDLQEPLRMVTTFLTQLEQKYGEIIDAKGKQYIYFAVDGAKRMRQIILDLLEFSRVGKSDDSMKEVSINKVVADILALYRKQIEEQSALIVFEGLPTLQSFKVPIRQVFQNLISNSLKYQQTGIPPFISISCEDSGTYWKFAVKDNGIGIDPEYFDKIFIIFQRLHNKTEYSGTGMGLAITKKIIENLGGKIWVESKEGTGSTFYFTILKHN